MLEKTIVLQYADDTILFLGFSKDLGVNLRNFMLIFPLFWALELTRIRVV